MRTLTVLATLSSLSDGGQPPRQVERDELSAQAASAIGRYWPL